MQADLDPAFDEGPLGCRTQLCQELIKRVRIGRGKLEPGQEVELLVEVTAVMKASCDRRKVPGWLSIIWTRTTESSEAPAIAVVRSTIHAPSAPPAKVT